MVVLAFRAKKPGSRLRMCVARTTLKTIVPVYSQIQATICGIWLGTSPPFLNKESHSEPGVIIIECNKGSITAYSCVLGYMGLLVLVSFIVAFLARSLPDTFTEAKFVTFSMLVFCSDWISFLPTHHSTKGKAKVAMEIFSILASSATLCTFIFICKCYVILLRPEKNVEGCLKKR
uniref:G-protein coupled receptors family 3 profile domain-containing protein n=1 Tax=Equus asinus TaxID=9793 RepID=A0A9L0IH08_EQUAS